MSRRTGKNGSPFDTAVVYAPDARLLDPPSIAAEASLRVQGKEGRRLFEELLQDCPSELQRELVRRALAAGRDPEELHAFADALRPLDDLACLSACTPPDRIPGEPDPYEEAALLLAAEVDPVAAYRLNGHRLKPRRRTSAPRPSSPRPGREPDWSSGEVEPPRVDAQDGARSPARASGERPAGCLSEEQLNEAARPLGVTYRVCTPGEGGETLTELLARAAQAIAGGMPVPVALGSKEGELIRAAVLIQSRGADRTRAFELYEPFAGELVWAHERDLLAGKALPLTNKRHRRLTAFALPRRSRVATAPSF